MNGVSAGVALWLEQKRRRDRAAAAVIAAVALGGGIFLFLLISLALYTVIGAFFHSVHLVALLAVALTAVIFVRCSKLRPDERELNLDPMGLWILRDIFSVGPRLIREGLRQVRCCGQLGELDVAACARALAYLAKQNAPVTWLELIHHCAQVPSSRLREQLSLLDGVLFLGDDADRLTLMDPFRVRLRWMMGSQHEARNAQEPARPRPEPAQETTPVTDPEKLSAYEILGVSASASLAEIKAAYRKRVKECHPDLFAGMDQQAKALAERWTKALNAAYTSLKPRRADAKPGVTEPR